MQLQDNIYPLTEKNISIIPAHFIDIHKEGIKYFKTISLFDYYIAQKKSGIMVSEKNEIFLPSLIGKISKDQNLEDWLKLFISSEQTNDFSARCTKKYFSKRENDVHRDYFLLCCFPTLFNFFSSDEYLKCGSEFIENYKKVTKGVEGVSVSYFDLAQTYILQNYEFRQVFIEKFYLSLNDAETGGEAVYQAGTQYTKLLSSFSFCLSYLKMPQIELLKNMIKDSKEDTAKFLIKNIFLPLIKLWGYAPQFCATELLWQDREVKDVKDEKSDIKEIKKKSKIVEFLKQKISNTQIYESEKADFDLVFESINGSPSAIPIVLSNVLEDSTMDKMLLCGFDIKLFNEIIDCGDSFERITIKSRMPLNPDSTTSDYNNMNRFFYVDVELAKPKVAQDNMQKKKKLANPGNKSKASKEKLQDWAKTKKDAEEKGVYIYILRPEDCRDFYNEDRISHENKMKKLRMKMQSERLLKDQIECAKKVLQSVILKFSKLYFIYPEKQIKPKDFINIFRKGFVTSLNTFSEEILWGKNSNEANVKRPIKEIESCIINVSEESESQERIKMYLDQLTEFGKKNINQNFTISQEVTERVNFCIEIYGMYEFGQFFTLMNLSPIDLQVEDKYERPKNIDTTDTYFKDIESMGYNEILKIARKYKDFITKNNKGYFTGFSFLGLAEISTMICEMLKELCRDSCGRDDKNIVRNVMGRTLVFEIFGGDEDIFNSYAFLRCLINNSKEKYNVKFPANTTDRIIEVYTFMKNSDQ